MIYIHTHTHTHISMQHTCCCCCRRVASAISCVSCCCFSCKYFHKISSLVNLLRKMPTELNFQNFYLHSIQFTIHNDHTDAFWTVCMRACWNIFIYFQSFWEFSPAIQGFGAVLDSRRDLTQGCASASLKVFLPVWCVEVCCSVLQCVAVCCIVLQCVALCCSALRDLTQGCAAACPQVFSPVLWCVAVCCSVLQCVAVRSGIWLKAAPSPPCRFFLLWCIVLQCVAVCCGVLQSVAVCCSFESRQLLLGVCCVVEQVHSQHYNSLQHTATPQTWPSFILCWA